MARPRLPPELWIDAWQYMDPLSQWWAGQACRMLYHIKHRCGPDDGFIPWRYAAQVGDIVSFRRIAPPRENCPAAMMLACAHGQRGMVEYLQCDLEISLNATHFDGACQHADVDMVVWVGQRIGMQMGYRGLVPACIGGNLPVAQFLLGQIIEPRHASIIRDNLDAGLYHACSAGHVDVARWLLSIGATAWNLRVGGFLAHAPPPEILQLLQERGLVTPQGTGWRWT